MAKKRRHRRTRGARSYEVVSRTEPDPDELNFEMPQSLLEPEPERRKPMELLSPEEVAAQMKEADVQYAAENFSTLPDLPESPTPEQAVAWLEDILARRQLTPKPGVPYRNPNLTQDDYGNGTGPSIIEGDAPVKFKVQETRQGRTVAKFGPAGSRYGKDMPFVSDQLKYSVVRALRYLPGYTEYCKITGLPLSQDLIPITNMLLRGQIRRLKNIHFKTESEEGQELKKRQRIAEHHARLNTGKERKGKLLKKLELLLAADPRIPETVARLHTRNLGPGA